MRRATPTRAHLEVAVKSEGGRVTFSRCATTAWASTRDSCAGWDCWAWKNACAGWAAIFASIRNSGAEH